MKPLKKSISVTLDEDLLVKLKERADLDDRSVSSYINLIVRAYFRNLEKKEGEHDDSPEAP